jgi:hypothetical protein
VAYDHKQFLDLLEDYKSEETKKARRNVSALAFVIVVAWILEVRLTDVRFLSLDISRANEVSVLVIAFVLLAYWTAMFFLAWVRDREIQKERSWYLDSEAGRQKERLKQIEANERQNPSAGRWPDRNEVENWIRLYEAQQSRTKLVGMTGFVIGRFEVWVPLALSAIAALVLMYAVVRVVW